MSLTEHLVFILCLALTITAISMNIYDTHKVEKNSDEDFLLKALHSCPSVIKIDYIIDYVHNHIVI